MALDLALNANGDLKVAPNKDIEVVTGRQTVDQRIRVRLRVYGGEWLLDPSHGRLGSRLRETLRLPIWRTREEIPFVVKEALEPMTDISVRDVLVEQDADVSDKLNVTILYSILDEQNTDNQVLSTTLTIEG